MMAEKMAEMMVDLTVDSTAVEMVSRMAEHLDLWLEVKMGHMLVVRKLEMEN